MKSWIVCLLLVLFASPALAQQPGCANGQCQNGQCRVPANVAVITQPPLVVRVPQPYVYSWVGLFGKVHTRMVWR